MGGEVPNELATSGALGKDATIYARKGTMSLEGGCDAGPIQVL